MLLNATETVAVCLGTGARQTTAAATAASKQASKQPTSQPINQSILRIHLGLSCGSILRPTALGAAVQEAPPSMAAEGVFHPLGFNEVGGDGHAVNGRVAMMAAIGASAQHYIKFPGSERPPIDLSVLVRLGVVDFTVPVGPAADDDMRSRELNDGRMAMFAAQGIFAAELLTGQTLWGSRTWALACSAMR